MITYKGKIYRTRNIVREDQIYTVAEESLNQLIQEDPSPELEDIDSGIVYYCTDEEMYMTEQELIKIIFG